MHAVVPIIVVALLLGFVWVVVQHFSAVFVVRVDRGEPRVERGRVSAEFVYEVGDVCRQYGVERGEIRGVGAGRRVALRFSGEISLSVRQRLRNVWAQCQR